MGRNWTALKDVQFAPATALRGYGSQHDGGHGRSHARYVPADRQGQLQYGRGLKQCGLRKCGSLCASAGLRRRSREVNAQGCQALARASIGVRVAM